MRVALVIDDADWHARALLAAFAAIGVEAVPMRLADCAFDTTAPHGLSLPGFPGALPGSVLIRSFGGGGFEAVTRRLGLLHALRDLGVRVWNDARAIERCVDKSMTSFLLARAGIATPPTWAVEGIEAAREIVRRENANGEKLVCKPLFGAQGVGLRLIDTADDLPAPEMVGNTYYLQRYVPTGAESFRDHRLFVIGDTVEAAMTRRASHWITNIRRGALPEACSPDATLCALAIQATEAVGAAYAGVDLLHDREGRAMVLEVNSMPGWKGLQSVSETDIARSLVQRLVTPPPRRSVEQAFRDACIADVTVAKPGNVSLHAPGHRMTGADFLHSAEAAAGPLCAPTASLGERILGAVQATRSAVGQNTNLGIILLCAPLAMAAQRGGDLADTLRRVLREATRADTEAVFQAIALAAPAGLGSAGRHDVHAPATVSLREAMIEAAERDSVARQYATDFADVLGRLSAAYRAAPPGDAVLATYLHCLATWPDSHVARKHGVATAEAVRAEAKRWKADLAGWDADLKRRGINPGTSADLTVATIFAHGLRNGLPRRPDDG